MTEKDYCDNCPMYYNGYDYCGECIEGCELNKDGWFNGRYDIFCKLPIIIKNIYQKYERKKYLKWLENNIKSWENAESEEVNI